jgi:hypothetical protein
LLLVLPCEVLQGAAKLFTGLLGDGELCRVEDFLESCLVLSELLLDGIDLKTGDVVVDGHRELLAHLFRVDDLAKGIGFNSE